jgi:cell division protein FtsL
MARAATAAARSAAVPAHAPVRRRPRPAQRPPARRKSGPARSSATAAPKPRALVALPNVRVPRGAAVLDRLLTGRLWIACVGVLLVGIVFLNVSVLRLNESIASMSAKADALKRQNAGLRETYAQQSSTERIQRVATQRGLVLPQPGDVHYLKAKRSDAGRAARGITQPQVQTAPTPTPTPTTTSAPATTATGATG